MISITVSKQNVSWADRSGPELLEIGEVDMCFEDVELLIALMEHMKRFLQLGL